MTAPMCAADRARCGAHGFSRSGQRRTQDPGVAQRAYLSGGAAAPSPTVTWRISDRIGPIPRERNDYFCGNGLGRKAALASPCPRFLTKQNQGERLLPGNLGGDLDRLLLADCGRLVTTHWGRCIPLCCCKSAARGLSSRLRMDYLWLKAKERLRAYLRFRPTFSQPKSNRFVS
jgi:hypothetical protein